MIHRGQILGIRGEHQHRRDSAEQIRHTDSRQDHQHRCASPYRGDPQDQRGGYQREDEGVDDRPQGRCHRKQGYPRYDGQGDTQRRSGGNARGVRIGQGVLEARLHRHTAHSQRGSDGDGRYRSWKTAAPYQLIFPVLLECLRYNPFEMVQDDSERIGHTYVVEAHTYGHEDSDDHQYRTDDDRQHLPAVGRMISLDETVCPHVITTCPSSGGRSDTGRSVRR